MSSPTTETPTRKRHEPQSLGSEEWLTVLGVCAVADVRAKLIYREIKAGRLRAARIGSRRGPVRVHRSWVQAWLEAASMPVEIQTRPRATTCDQKSLPPA